MDLVWEGTAGADSVQMIQYSLDGGVMLYTMQDNYTSPVEPTDVLTFTKYGVTGFTVEAWNGSAWATQATVTRIKLPLANAYLVQGKRPILVDTGAPGDADRHQARSAECPFPPQTQSPPG